MAGRRIGRGHSGMILSLLLLLLLLFIIIISIINRILVLLIIIVIKTCLLLCLLSGCWWCGPEYGVRSRGISHFRPVALGPSVRKQAASRRELHLSSDNPFFNLNSTLLKQPILKYTRCERALLNVISFWTCGHADLLWPSASKVCLAGKKVGARYVDVMHRH